MNLKNRNFVRPQQRMGNKNKFASGWGTHNKSPHTFRSEKGRKEQGGTQVLSQGSPKERNKRKYLSSSWRAEAQTEKKASRKGLDNRNIKRERKKSRRGHNKRLSERLKTGLLTQISGEERKTLTCNDVLGGE